MAVIGQTLLMCVTAPSCTAVRSIRDVPMAATVRTDPSNKCARVVGDVMGQFHFTVTALSTTPKRLIYGIMRYPAGTRVRHPGSTTVLQRLTSRPRWLPLPEMVRAVINEDTTSSPTTTLASP